MPHWHPLRFEHKRLSAHTASQTRRQLLFNALMPDIRPSPPLTWLEPGQPFPPVSQAWGQASDAPGLLAAGDAMDAAQLVAAYRQGIFPWFSTGQPVLWWSPDPRMVLPLNEFKLHRSLRQTLKNWTLEPGVEMAFDRDFAQVIARCGQAPRPGQTGSWIVPAIVQAYTQLHRMGLAHSAEIWKDGHLVAGLYFVSLGHTVFGESMFTTVRDGSKMALAMLVSAAKRHGVQMIDCQQNTRHLASLGGREIPREDFVQWLGLAQSKPTIDWANETLYWDTLTGFAL
jgi:leucyl/phenylalanyl-tRNA--protein transferase